MVVFVSRTQNTLWPTLDVLPLIPPSLDCILCGLALDTKEELFNLRFQGATGQLENHGRLRAVRKDIARLYTVMRERELGITAEPEIGAEQ